MHQSKRVREIMFTPAEVAELMNVSPSTVTKWLKQGLVKCVKIGGIIRIPSSEFRAFKLTDVTKTGEPRYGPQEEHL